VQVRELGDFSVTYRVAGLLEDVTSLISARSRLRAAMLDVLHAENIEIVSPNFMNTRTLDDKQRFIPIPSRKTVTQVQAQPEEIAFDKAEEAASVERVRVAIEQTAADLKALDERDDEADPAERTALEKKKAHLLEQLRAGEEAIKAREVAEKEAGSKRD
jgi:alcohol dehydrogenase YqhD (iron-dependent ADH family)